MSNKANVRAGSLLIYGASIYGGILRDLAQALDIDFGGFIDDWNSGDDIIGTFDDLARADELRRCRVAIGVGYKYMRERRELAARLQGLGIELATLVHPRAYVAKNVRLGCGTVIMAGAIVDTCAEIGPLTVLWPGAVVNHHCRLAGNTFLSPSSTVCGSTSIGHDCFIGAGATVVDNVAVPDGTFLKAGTVYSGGNGARREGRAVRSIRSSSP